MQDRVPLYPGRVTMTPVAGQANTYDMVRTDDPTQAGTPLNKATFLKDTTAALFGLGTDAVPDDVLSKLSKGVLAQTAGKYTETTIGTLAIGSTITVNVNGTPTKFLVVHQGKPSNLYDDSCDGTWLLMKDIYENRVWGSDNVNKYETSDINSYLNSTFLNLFGSNIKNAIKQVKIPHRKNGGTGGTDQSGANGLSTKIFLLSGYEVGWTTSDYSSFPVDGEKLSYFESGTGTSANNKRIAKLGGSATSWWLRSPRTNLPNGVWCVLTNGNCELGGASGSRGIRPALVLPSTFAVYTDSSGNIYTEQEYETALTDVLGTKISIPASQIKDGVKIETGSYVGTGTYGQANPNTLTFGFAPKFLILAGLFEYPTRSDYRMFAFLGPYGGFASSAYRYWDDSSGSLNSVFAEVSGNTISWYKDSAVYQMNDTKSTYFYVAIG